MHPSTITAMVVGALILGGSLAGARHPTIHPAEQRVFRAINGWPNWLYWPLWVPMQLGNLVIGTAAGLLLAWRIGDLRMALAVLGATVLKLVGKRVIRHWMAPYLKVRQRPGTSEPGAVLRGHDVPISGPSFPSGHVILVAAICAIVADDVTLGWLSAPLVLTLLVMVGRVYVGAHNPLDVTAGLGAGLLAGAVVDVLASLGT